jgi:hypothetical protein
VGLLDRLFGRRDQRGSGDRFTRDDSSQYVQPPATEQSGGHGESHHPGSDQGSGQQDPGQGSQDPGQASHDQSSQDAPAGWDVQGDLEAAGGDSGGGDAGGGDSGGGGDGGGGGNGGGGGD